ncbi:hypothetical protein ACFE04_013903 [Oxalis oulophora]
MGLSHGKQQHIRRNDSVRPSTSSDQYDDDQSQLQLQLELDKTFGFLKNFGVNYQLDEEVGRGHSSYTCCAKPKKWYLKAQDVAVKVIPKSKMKTAVAVEGVGHEVKILQALSGHKNLLKFYDAFEDDNSVYIVTELCKGDDLLDRILSRGGIYAEDDAKVVMVQILNVVAYLHLQGVVHRDLKLEKFLFTSKEENSPLKVIDFARSGYVKTDERLKEILGNKCYIAPEVLYNWYGTEADMWSIGVIAYILLCGLRPFWAPTDSGILQAVLKEDPNFDVGPWPNLSPEAGDFVKRLLNKDYRKRLTAAQALSHPWLVNHHDLKIPLDMIIFRLVKSYICSSSLGKSASQALAKTLTVPQLAYLRGQFTLLGPNKDGYISIKNFKMALAKNSTVALKDSRVVDFVSTISCLQYRNFDFEEFCAAAISVHQLGMNTWEEHARHAYELFENDGNRPIMIEELTSELKLSTTVPIHVVLQDWINHSDGKLSFLGFVKLSHVVSSDAFQKV